MFHRRTRGLLVGALIVGQAAFPATSEAGPLLDWLLGRQTTYALYCPTTVQSPATACAPAATAYAPVVQNPAPAATTAYAPVVAAQPTVASVAPTAAFQTMQAQVPVTYYRPTSALSPTAAVAATPALSGCTLVQVQTQRRRAWWDLLGLFTPREPVSPYPINVQVPTAVAMPATTVLPGPAAAPTTPACPSCPTTAPAFPSVPSATVMPGAAPMGAPPAATYPAPPGPGGAQTVPADQPPTLNPSPQGSYQGSSYRPAPAQPIAPAPSLSPPAGFPESSPVPPAAEPSARPGDEPSPQQPEANRLQLIPYPGQGGPQEDTSAPPLLNPRARTASLRRIEPWSYAPINWSNVSEVRRAGAAAPARQTTPPPRAGSPSVSPMLDDGGWRPARGQ